MSRFVYADNAATTAVSKPVLDAMLPYFSEKYGNPSSIYSIGRDAHEALDEARKKVADALGAQPQEIFFTGCGSESDNWAIRGIAHANIKKGKHLITSKFEHHAVLHTMRALEKEGFEVTYLDVNANGVVNPADLEKAIRPDTTLVTVMYANNEVGTIEPIPEIGRVCRDKGVLFHTDAVQAVTHVPINVQEQNIDMLSLSAHKFHGPKGTGVLYCKTGVRLFNLIEGGAQERGKRAGTENIPGIVGTAAAMKEACGRMEENRAYVTRLRDKVIAELTKIPHSILNGDTEHRLPGNINMCFEGIEGESLLLKLDDEGIEASSGSACTSGSLEPSHVLLALGLPAEVAHGSLRLTLSEYNTEEEIDHIIKTVPQVVAYLRNMSPFWEELQKGERKYYVVQ